MPTAPFRGHALFRACPHFCRVPRLACQAVFLQHGCHACRQAGFRLSQRSADPYGSSRVLARVPRPVLSERSADLAWAGLPRRLGGSARAFPQNKSSGGMVWRSQAMIRPVAYSVVRHTIYTPVTAADARGVSKCIGKGRIRWVCFQVTYMSRFKACYTGRKPKFRILCGAV